MRSIVRIAMLCLVILPVQAGGALAQLGNEPGSPGNSGLLRFHFNDGSLGCSGILDRGNDLLVTWCDHDALFRNCGGDPTAAGMIAVQAKQVSEATWILVEMDRRNYGNVYDLTGGTAFDCALFTNETGRLLATGTVDAVYTDSDFFGTRDGEDRGYAWGWRIHGSMVDTVNGGMTILNGRFQANVAYSGALWQSNVSLKLIPDPRN